MYNVTNKKESAKMYSIIGKKTTGGELELVQNGMFGEIGELIEGDVYEFLPVSATAKDIFVLATPEVDADESDFNNNTLHGFKLALGQIADATQIERHAKGEISEDMVNGVVGKTGYLYLKAGDRKLTYKATKPETADAPLLIAQIERVYQPIQGVIVSSAGQVVPTTKNIVFRYLQTV